MSNEVQNKDVPSSQEESQKKLLQRAQPEEPPPKWYTHIWHKIIGKNPDKNQIKNTLRQYTKKGYISQDAFDIISGALAVEEKQVRDVMIPRAQMITINRTATDKNILDIIANSSHSRFPVTDTENDDVIGIIMAKDILRNQYKGQTNFFETLRPPTYIPESKRLYVLLKEFREKRQHMAIVIDEYGKPIGLITIEDVLEEIVGDIEDEHDKIKSQQIANINPNTWLVDAMIDIENFNNYFKTNFDTEHSDTISGVLLQAFSRIPKVDEQITIDNFTYLITKANPKKIIMIQVSKTD